MTQHRRRNEKGITIVMVALFIFVLFMIAAIAIDVGVLYTARTSAQHAADAAALAGAFTFLNPDASQPDAATNAAVAAAAKNTILGTPVSIDPTNDVLVDQSNRRVKVTVSRLQGNGIATFFAKVMNINSADVQTKATAEAANPQGGATGSYCLKPFYIPNTALSSESQTNACTDQQVIFDSGGNLTPFAIGMIGKPMPNGMWDQSAPSQWGLLDIGGAGASGLACNISSCLNACSSGSPPSCGGQPIPVLTGAKTGIVRKAVNDLVTVNGSQNPDTFLAVGQYIDGGTGQTKDTSPSLAPVVVWDDCNSSITPGRNNEVVMAGYAQVFVDSVRGNHIDSHFVGGASCSSAASGGGGTGPLALPVRLVQTP